MIRKALCDDDGSVRQAAARTFDSLHTVVGNRALDDILPAMLEHLSDPELHEHTDIASKHQDHTSAAWRASRTSASS